MSRSIPILCTMAATLISTTVIAADRDGSGRVAWVTDGDTFRLESGERIRIARIDAPETQRGQAKCADEIRLGSRAKEQATTLLAGREVTFRRVGRSYNRTVATVTIDGRDLGTELVRLGVAPQPAETDMVWSRALNACARFTKLALGFDTRRER